MNMSPSVKRCPEKRAHYAHEFYTPLRTQCPGGPDETSVGPCWHDSGVTWPNGFQPRCQLRAGHPGAHECDRGHLGGTAIWDDAGPTEGANPALTELETLRAGIARLRQDYFDSIDVDGLVAADRVVSNLDALMAPGRGQSLMSREEADVVRRELLGDTTTEPSPEEDEG